MEATEDKDEPAVVFTGGPIEAGLLQGKLADADIKSFLHNEFMGGLGTTAIGVKVAVRADDLPNALPVVNAFNEARRIEESDTSDSDLEGELG